MQLEQLELCWVTCITYICTCIQVVQCDTLHFLCTHQLILDINHLVHSCIVCVISRSLHSVFSCAQHTQYTAGFVVHFTWINSKVKIISNFVFFCLATFPSDYSSSPEPAKHFIQPAPEIGKHKLYMYLICMHLLVITFCKYMLLHGPQAWCM